MSWGAWRDTRTSQTGSRHVQKGSFDAHVLHIEKTLKLLGADTYDLLLPESKCLPHYIEPDERIMGIVYGRYHQENSNAVGRGALIATNKRIMLLDKKPLFVSCDELSYIVVSGVTYTKAGLAGTVSLHARIGDINIRTFNQMCARIFVKAVEENLYQYNESKSMQYRYLSSVRDPRTGKQGGDEHEPHEIS